MDSKGGKKKRSSSGCQCERVIPLGVAELRPWGVPKYQTPAFADVSPLLPRNLCYLLSQVIQIAQNIVQVNATRAPGVLCL